MDLSRSIFVLKLKGCEPTKVVGVFVFAAIMVYEMWNGYTMGYQYDNVDFIFELLYPVGKGFHESLLSLLVGFWVDYALVIQECLAVSMKFYEM